MPDPRPLPSVQFGGYDNPPASSESVSNRRSRIRRVLRHLGSEDPADMTTQIPLSERSRRLAGSSLRRRRRSVSPLDPDFDTSTPELPGSSTRPRNKRRKLDQSPAAQKARTPIKYGYYGQVEPGRLKMELVSCDGGEHKDPRSTVDLGPDNVLRHDKSVYCSERNSVNIVMRHADDTAFCLEKLHIIAPEKDFTSPVCEGVIYIAMTMSELLEYIDAPTPPRINISPPEGSTETAPPRIAPNRSIRGSPERLTLADALRDPEIDAAITNRAYARGADGLHDLSAEPNAEEELYAADFGHGYTDLACPDLSQPDPDYLDAIAHLSQSDNEGRSHSQGRRSRPFTLLSDEEPGPEDTSPPGWTEYRLQRWRNMRRRAEIENWDRDERWSGLNRLPPEPAPADMAGDPRERAMWNLSRLDALMARSRVRDDEEDLATPLSPPSPGAAGPPLSVSAYDRYGRYDRAERRETRDLPSGSDAKRAVQASSEDEKAVSSNVRRVHFHIKKSKHKVAIKFTPPVSGRFVLLKLWSGNTKGNVDVQTVILKGYGGGRFFPAVEMR